MPTSIAKKEYYSIGEVCEITRLKPHVLRYWESQFKILSPSKNRAGNRVYRRKEIQVIQLVKYLLYVEKYTIEGAKKKLEELRRGPSEQFEATIDEVKNSDILRSIKLDLKQLLNYLRNSTDELEE